jgi:hypothetical protein
MSSSSPPAGAAEPSSEAFSTWMHRLRNEVNSVQMATSAAQVLLDAGKPEAARENMERARQACRRCAQLLNSEPPPER